MRFSAESERTLRHAGWYPGRTVDTESWRVPMEQDGFVFPEVAVRFLTEFHGLSFPDNGAGISRARAPFEFDPLLVLGDEDSFSAWAADLGRAVAPLGELDRGRFYLGMDELGGIYRITDGPRFFGVGDAGLENLVLGVMSVEPQSRLS